MLQMDKTLFDAKGNAVRLGVSSAVAVRERCSRWRDGPNLWPRSITAP